MNCFSFPFLCSPHLDSLHTARFAVPIRLLDDNCTVLRCLGRALPFELAIGVNGLVWVHSAGVTQTIVISNAILNSHQMPPHLVEMMVNKLVQRVSA